MNPEAGDTISIWMATAHMPEFPALTESIECDVCVVGAGITGISTAYLLCRAGKKVVLIEDGPICAGETQRTTAHLSDVVDDRYSSIIKSYGDDKARLVYESHRNAISQIEKNVKEEGIDCDFQRLDGFLFPGENKSVDELKKEFDAVRQINYQGVEMLDELPLQDVPVQNCLRFANQGQFHPLKYLSGLVQSIQKQGGSIYTRTRCVDIEDGEQVTVHTQNGPQIKASHCVIATNSPIGDRVRVHTKQHAYRTYVLGCRIRKNSIPRGLYWDMEDPYHYVRIQKLDNNDEYECLLVGGADHRTGEEPDEDPFAGLEAWALKWFVGVHDVMFRWSGQVFEPVDGLAFIGRDPAHGSNVFLSTGDSGMGMTHGTMASMIIHDLIVGKANKFAQLYDPARKPFAETAEFIKENVSGLVRYFDYATPGEVKSTEEIEPGEGAVIRRGLEKIAVYKDPSGNCHEMSAVCPHMKGIVHWNSTEKTWDCPLHGSRFNAEGCLVNGPANSDLELLSGTRDASTQTFDASPPDSPTYPAATKPMSTDDVQVVQIPKEVPEHPKQPPADS